MDNKIDNFISGLTESELIAILEAARVALADAEIAEKVGERMDLSDADINHLQHKVHVIMCGVGPSPE